MLVTVGTVGGARGLQGQVGVYLRTDLPQERFAPGAQLITDNPRYPRLHVASSQQTNKAFYVKFTEVTDRTGAEALRGTQLQAEVDEDVELAADSEAFYPSQLRGFCVVAPSGEELGIVADLEIGAGQDRLVIETAEGVVRLPFVTALVPTIDMEQRRVVAHIPSGLVGL